MTRKDVNEDVLRYFHVFSLYSESDENDERNENFLYCLHGYSLYSENHENDEKDENILLGVAMNGIGSLLQY